MKKLLLSVSFVAMTIASSFAQDFKPQAGDITFGTAFQSPFASGSPFSLSKGVLNGRYFLATDMAVRVGINYSRTANTNDCSDSVAASILAPFGPKMWQEATTHTANSKFDIRLGAEKHFAGTNRLDPYAGADLLLGFGRNVEKDENYNSTLDVTETNYIREKTRSTTSVGVALVIGADYYVFPKVYIGTEFGWSFVKSFVGDATEEVSHDVISGGVVVNKVETPVTTLGSKSTVAGADMTTAAFRVGFRF